jgi:TolB-like protein
MVYFHKELFMRKRSLLFFVVLCVALESAITQTKAPVSLDDAITNAVRYLHTTIPLRSRVAVIHFGTSGALHEYLTENFTNKLKSNPQLIVSDQRNIVPTIKQFTPPSHEALADATARDMGKRLNVDVVITGAVRLTDSVYRFSVQAVAVKTNQVYWSYSYIIQPDRNFLALLE